MTVIELIEIIGFSITLITTGVAIGKQVERLNSKNKNDRQ